MVQRNASARTIHFRWKVQSLGLLSIEMRFASPVIIPGSLLRLRALHLHSLLPLTLYIISLVSATSPLFLSTTWAEHRLLAAGHNGQTKARPQWNTDNVEEEKIRKTKEPIQGSARRILGDPGYSRPEECCRSNSVPC